jgi:uncharacterized NAD(P)/FAD-binding protein YdhS
MFRKKHIAIIGGGPSGLFMYKSLINGGQFNIRISIFETKTQLGAGMPYSAEGANVEHITNVSDHEIPELVTSMEEWIDTLSSETLRMFNIDPDSFNEHKVVPRLLFGKYLSTQFDLLKKQADQSRIDTQVYLNSTVSDITDRPEEGIVIVTTASNETFIFDAVVICAGHKWPLKYDLKLRFEEPFCLLLYWPILILANRICSCKE